MCREIFFPETVALIFLSEAVFRSFPFNNAHKCIWYVHFKCENDACPPSVWKRNFVPTGVPKNLFSEGRGRHCHNFVAKTCKYTLHNCPCHFPLQLRYYVVVKIRKESVTPFPDLRKTEVAAGIFEKNNKPRNAGNPLLLCLFHCNPINEVLIERSRSVEGEKKNIYLFGRQKCVVRMLFSACLTPSCEKEDNKRMWISPHLPLPNFPQKKKISFINYNFSKKDGKCQQV